MNRKVKIKFENANAVPVDADVIDFLPEGTTGHVLTKTSTGVEFKAGTPGPKGDQGEKGDKGDTYRSSRVTAVASPVEAGSGSYTFTITSELFKNSSAEFSFRGTTNTDEGFLRSHLTSYIPTIDTSAGTITFTCDDNNSGTDISFTVIIFEVEDAV